jgi:hypothetical protein
MSVRGRSLVLAGALAGALVLGCGSLDAGTDSDGGPGGQVDAPAQNPNGSDGSIDQDPSNPTCHEQTIAPQPVGDPDIMILMDMSSSMDDGTSTPSKYQQTATAITNTIVSLETAGSPIEWGLIFFPNDGNCGVANWPDEEIQVANATQIGNKLTSTTPNGNTPAHLAVNLAASYYGGLNDGRAHYILIATDGEPNCEGDPPLVPKQCHVDADCNDPNQYCQIIPGWPGGGGVCMPKPQDLAIHAIESAAAAGIKTYVVGISIDGAATSTLDRMAVAGGTARAGEPKYYPVSDQATLENTLQNITTQIISCTFGLEAMPPDLQYVYVSIAGQQVAYDPTHADGWDIESGSLTLTLYGQACTDLQQNPQTVQIIYGCPPVS